MAHCTGARFAILVSCSDELAVHSYPLLRLQLQRQVTNRVARHFLTKKPNHV